MTTHKMSETREYKAWRRMKGACFNPNFPYYDAYGGAGITVCPRWKDDFLKFLEDMGQMPANCNGIALIASKKDFCKVNCRWVTKMAGRKQLPQNISDKPRPMKRIKNPKTVCLVISKEHIDFIRKLAMRRSVEENNFVEANTLIREALEKVYPLPKQMDFVDERSKSVVR